MKLDKLLGDILETKKKETEEKKSLKNDVVIDSDKVLEDIQKLDEVKERGAYDWPFNHIRDAVSKAELGSFSKTSKILSFPYPFAVLMTNVSKLAAGDKAAEKHLFKMSTINARFAPVSPGDKRTAGSVDNTVSIRDDVINVDGKTVNIATDDSSLVKDEKDVPVHEYKYVKKYLKGKNKDWWHIWKWFDPLRTNDYVRLRHADEYTLVPLFYKKENKKKGTPEQGRPKRYLDTATGQIVVDEKVKYNRDFKKRAIDIGRSYHAASYEDMGRTSIGAVLSSNKRQSLIHRLIDYYNKFVYYEKSSMPVKEKRKKENQLVKEFSDDPDMRKLTGYYLSFVQPSTTRDIVKPSLKGMSDEEIEKMGGVELSKEEKERLDSFGTIYNDIIDEMSPKYNLATIKTMLLASTGFSNFVFSKQKYGDPSVKFATGENKIFNNTYLLSMFGSFFKDTPYEGNEVKAILDNVEQIPSRMFEGLKNIFSDDVSEEQIKNYEFMKNPKKQLGNISSIKKLQPVFDAVKKDYGLTEMAQSPNIVPMLRHLYVLARRYVLENYDSYLQYDDYKVPKYVAKEYDDKFNKLEGYPAKADEIENRIFKMFSEKMSEKLEEYKERDIEYHEDDEHRLDTRGLEYVYVIPAPRREIVYGQFKRPARQTYAQKMAPKSEQKFGIPVPMMPVTMVLSGDKVAPGILEQWFFKKDKQKSKPYIYDDTTFEDLYLEYVIALQHGKQIGTASEQTESEIEQLKKEPGFVAFLKKLQDKYKPDIDKVDELKRPQSNEAFIELLNQAKTMNDMDSITALIKAQKTASPDIYTDQDLFDFIKEYNEAIDRIRYKAKKSKLARQVSKRFGQDYEKAIEDFHKRVNELGLEYLTIVNRYLEILLEGIAVKYEPLIKPNKKQGAPAQPKLKKAMGEEATLSNFLDSV